MNKNTDIKESTQTIARVIKPSDLSITMPETVANVKIAYAISLRVQRQNWRQGTVACKGRSDVSRSGKKPWKQKGTGRARAGDAASPLWKGGGVIHGPQPRTRELKVSKKARRGVFGALFSDYVNRNAIISLDYTVSGDRPMTRHAWKALNTINDYNYTKKMILFADAQDHLVHIAFANIKNVQVVYFDQPNVYDLSNARHWVFLKKDTEQFKKMVEQWL